MKTVLLAAHQRVMAMLYNQTDVISGLIGNGRPEELDGEKVIGLFLNNLPVRQQLNGGTWLELIKQTFAAEQEIVAGIAVDGVIAAAADRGLDHGAECDGDVIHLAVGAADAK